MTRLVAADVGGTHARFALAEIGAQGAITLDEPITLNTHDYPDFAAAWRDFATLVGGELPHSAAIAAAGPLRGETLKLTNAPWLIDLSELRAKLGLTAITALNDFGAVAHAAARLPVSQLFHVAGPDVPLPERGTVSVIGPGTGLGVAHFLRHPGGYRVQATEGGHVGFAPQDEIDDRVLAMLRAAHGRVATERVNAGPGIVPIYQALGGGPHQDDRAIWHAGLSGEDELAALAVERFCASLGTVAGDFALAHGAIAVVLAGGLGLKLRHVLPESAFHARFCAKPRYEEMMAAMPVKLIVHPQPGLFGAAAAFQMEQVP